MLVRGRSNLICEVDNKAERVANMQQKRIHIKPRRVGSCNTAGLWRILPHGTTLISLIIKSLSGCLSGVYGGKRLRHDLPRSSYSLHKAAGARDWPLSRRVRLHPGPRVLRPCSQWDAFYVLPQPDLRPARERRDTGGQAWISHNPQGSHFFPDSCFATKW